MNTENKVKVKKTIKKKNIKINKFEDIENKFLLVKVGNEDSPATDDDIKNVQDKLIDLLERNKINCLIFVTHHRVNIEIIEKNDIKNKND